MKVYSGANFTKLDFSYNERGQRYKKELYANSSTAVTTWYVRDAAGNILSVYDNASGVIEQTEIPIYGLGRIGEARKSSTTISYVYELPPASARLCSLLRSWRNASACAPPPR